MKFDAKKAEELLETFALKKTKPRISLLNLLLKASSPLSANSIFKKLANDNPDKVTIYRTLDALEESGVIKKVHTGEREAKYEINNSADDHHHIICLKCKKIVDFSGCDADGLIKKALAQTKEFKNITHHSFDLFGICLKCGDK